MGAMVLKEQNLLFGEEYAEEQSQICVDANKAPNVQVLLEAGSCLFPKLHFLASFTEAT